MDVIGLRLPDGSIVRQTCFSLRFGFCRTRRFSGTGRRFGCGHKFPLSGRHGAYGEINHGGGYVTRYAHNKKNLVKIGDTVKKARKLP